MGADGKANILFVCLGNICRSTMSEGVFRHLAKSSSPHPLVGEVDSCGTGAYHVGDGPDSRTMSTLEDHGITDYDHCARKFSHPEDFHRFDYILAMDRENLSDLLRLRNSHEKKLKADGQDEKIGSLGKVMLFGDFGGRKGEVVDDPYYGGRNGFEIAYKQAMRFSEGLLKHLEAESA
ncbi:Low molecular weight phosphotyrosine protein phosphatase [Diplodia seriata]|uniref:Low molecular weight phosphotyrosine protein phosphatase n=1 Tax=Diplodia seriata TaxID=420778 RepID=A0A0G2EDV6_9PEZI|nr:putative low molecular weight phosphotyrosine protein phosphatase [Diplodia seriata]OMP82993.1 Low molecular weight phosphotyrosine protein phosphatase [Diplodia seriata]